MLDVIMIYIFLCLLGSVN